VQPSFDCHVILSLFDYIFRISSRIIRILMKVKCFMFYIFIVL